jgi:hypothetical protein
MEEYGDFEDFEFDQAEIEAFKNTRSSFENVIQDEIDEWSKDVEDFEDTEEKDIIQEFWKTKGIS